MPIVLRSSKNGALTFAEMDGNFTDLETRVNSKVDSANVLGIIDTTYINSIVDSSYVQSRQSMTGNYQNSNVDAHLNVSTASNGDVLKWNGSDYIWDSDVSNNLSSVSVTTMGASAGGFLSYDSSTGVFTFRPADLSGYVQIGSETSTLNDVVQRGHTTTTTAVIPFLYSNQGSFPNASTYHGAIAHSHADGAMYFAHAGSWHKLANDAALNGNTDAHLNVSGATSGQVLSWTGTDYDWVAQSSGGSGLDSAGVASYLNGGWNFHLIPDTNATYDIGSAEYKVRHLYLSDNSLYFDSGQTSIGFETVGTSKNLKFNNNVVKEASHTEEAAGPVDISKTNHFVTTGATYDLPNGEYVGQELKFWHKTQGGTNIVRVNVLNAKWRNGSGVLTTIPNMMWDQDKTNTACYGCIWDGEAWIIGEGSLGA